jgi:Domain of unknown function (DUF362)/Secretion system C-terminal sorting domain
MKNMYINSEKLERLRAKLSSFKLSAKVVFIIMGIASTLWFLIRVIQKPQRVGYPCMRAAAPIMSGFITYLLTLGGSALLFKRAFSKLKQSKFKAASVSLVFFIILVLVYSINDARIIKANTKASITPITWDTILPDGHNNPMGIAAGIFPGRVAWAWNPNATNDACTQDITDAMFMPKNNIQDTINMMADNAVRAIGGKSTVSASWDAIFKYFNNRKTGTATGYVTGQTIFIKINNGQAGWAIDMSDLSEVGEGSTMTGKSNIAIAETTPSTVLAFVRQLVDSCGIPQAKIYIGEPMTHVFKSMNDLIHSKYPSVKIMDKENHTSLGRTTSTGWTSNCIYYSDKNTVMTNSVHDDLMNEMYNANYLINICALKAHARAGVTLTAKLHFGSSTHNNSYSAFDQHAGLISTVDNDHMTDGVRGDYHMYRVLTDLMTHPKLGRNTVLFVVDGLWGGIEATDMPVKWKIAPFNNHWPNSLFVSQDEVAIQSVCLDFLRAEAKVNTLFNNRPLFPAVDDFLHQAADSLNWPAGIRYDPGRTGTCLKSLGVHEHWNNSSQKQYTRNLNTSGIGIELYPIPGNLASDASYNNKAIVTSITKPDLISDANSIKSFPNPFSSEVMIQYILNTKSNISIKVYNASGQLVANVLNANQLAGSYSKTWTPSGSLQSGIYFASVYINNSLSRSLKMNYIK